MSSARRTLLAFAIWAVAAAMSCRVIRAQDTEPMVMVRAALGWTACDHEGVVRSWVRTDLPPEQFAEVARHERVHREQAARHPSCAHYEAWLKGHPERLMPLEAEAYCRAATEAPRYREQLVMHLWMLFRDAVPLEDIIVAVNRHCV